MARKLNVKYGDIQIKQHSKVKFSGCMLDETISGEIMALFVIDKMSKKQIMLITVMLMMDFQTESKIRMMNMELIRRTSIKPSSITY